MYKIEFYEGTNNEYYTFTTRECALTGIDNYLSYRQRCGEKITPTISEQAKSNIDEIELDLVTSSQYFKPRPGTTYVIQVDLDKHKIKPVENPKFIDAQGKPLMRYELVITHVNNQKEQIWTVSKTVCMQIIEWIRKGFRTLKVTRTGIDRSTFYTIEGIQ